MKFFAHKGDVPIDQIDLSDASKWLYRTTDVIDSVVRHCRSQGWDKYRIYRYTDIDRPESYRLVATQNKPYQNILE